MVQQQTAVITGTRRARTTNARVVCGPTAKVLRGARKGVVLWKANDPDFMQAIYAENWITLMSELIPEVEGGPAPPSCDADGCDLGTHRQMYHFAQMAALNKLTVGIKALKRAAGTLGVPAPDLRSLSPFLGRANTMIVPSHVCSSSQGVRLLTGLLLVLAPSGCKTGAKGPRLQLQVHG